MGILGSLLALVGGIIGLVGGIWLLVLAFKKSVLWGLGTLFVPFVGLVFVIMNWAIAKKAFLIALAGNIVLGVGYAMIIAAAAKAAAASNGAYMAPTP